MDAEYGYAWAAGFLDGEGCFSLDRTSGKNLHPMTRAAVLSCAQKRREPLDRLAELFGGNVRPMRHDDYEGWQWVVQGERLPDVIPHLLPHLILKTREAEIVLEYAKTVRRRGRVAIPESEIRLRGQLIEQMAAERGGGQ